MSNRVLVAQSRKRTGSGVLNEMRREGFIPCVVYGGGEENQNLKIENKAFYDLLKGAASSNILVELDIEGKKQQVFIQDIQFNDLKQTIIHADFMAVNDKTEIKADIPLILTGDAAGVKAGGILDQLLYTVPIKCLPQNLPETLSTDIAHLNVSEAHHIGEMKFPEGVTPTLHDGVVVAMVAKTRVAQSAEASDESADGAGEATEEAAAE